MQGPPGSRGPAGQKGEHGEKVLFVIYWKIQNYFIICVIIICKGQKGVTGPRGLPGLNGVSVLQ